MMYQETLFLFSAASLLFATFFYLFCFSMLTIVKAGNGKFGSGFFMFAFLTLTKYIMINQVYMVILG